MRADRIGRARASRALLATLLGGAGIVFVSVGVGARDVQLIAGPSPDSEPPPIGVAWVAGQTFSREWSGGKSPSIRANTLSQEVVLEWWAGGSSLVQSATQRISCDYWPSAVAFGNAGELLIGGRDRLGVSTIESVLLADPVVLIDPTTQKPRLAPLPPRARNIGYQEDSPTRGMPIALSADPLSVGNVLAYFLQDHGIWRVDMATGLAEEVASPAPVSNGMQVDALAPRLAYFHVEKHADSGVVYSLGSISDDRSVVLLDSDLDGRIDSDFVQSMEQPNPLWELLDLGNPDKYQ